MPDESIYDTFADDYAVLVRTGLNDPYSVVSVATGCLLATAGPTRGQDVCDLGCGEGHLSRRLAQDARRVVGIDSSGRLLDLARQHDRNLRIEFVLDDAQHLTTQDDSSFDLVVINLALMDMPDLPAVYAAVHHVLRPGGRFVFSITHPCFQMPHSKVEKEESGKFLLRCLETYSQEGYWRSDYKGGVRGNVGAHHRKLSTYLNELITAGFSIIDIAEPTIPSGDYEHTHTQAQVNTPAVLVVNARK